jgi:diadenosine tetraphosphatase ApaH/serine/threonine PP2A family protein phosphatase
MGDIHANLEALTAVVEDARAEGCAHYVCVGDIVGYNANPNECLELVRELAMQCVKGNHDEYCSEDSFLPPLGVNTRAAAAVLWTRQQLGEAEREWLKALHYVRPVAGFSIVHATLDEPDRWTYVVEKVDAAASFTYQTTPVCFFGHTHLPMAFIRDIGVRRRYSTLQVEPGRQYFVNVGSVGEPRDGDPRASYAIYEPATGAIELRRVTYDSKKTAAKVEAAGLIGRRALI